MEAGALLAASWASVSWDQDVQNSGHAKGRHQHQDDNALRGSKQPQELQPLPWPSSQLTGSSKGQKSRHSAWSCKAGLSLRKENSQFLTTSVTIEDFRQNPSFVEQHHEKGPKDRPKAFHQSIKAVTIEWPSKSAQARPEDQIDLR